MSNITSAGGDEPQRPLRSLADVDPNEAPLHPWTDPNPEIDYTRSSQPRCNICKSHLALELEHVYWAAGKSPSAVVNHLESRWGVRYSWDAVKQHMENHVAWGTLRNSGLREIMGAMDVQLAIEWQLDDLAVHAALKNIDVLQAMPTMGSIKVEINKGKMLSQFWRDVEYFKEKRDAKRSGIVDVGSILREVYDALADTASRRIVAEKALEINERIRKAAKEGRA